MQLDASLTLSLNNKVFANPRRIALLEKITQTGSLNQAARQADISYKAAWDAVNAMNSAFDTPVVLSEKGGKGGGGARLTPFGQRLLTVYRLTRQVQDMALNALQDQNIAMDNLLDLMAHFSLQTSARNQFTAKITDIISVGINDRIVTTLPGGQGCETTVTRASSKRLGLEVGSHILLLLKAPSVRITTQEDQPNAGESALLGKLVSVRAEGNQSEVCLDIGGGYTVFSVMNTDTLAPLGLETGGRYQACFQSSHPVIASLGNSGASSPRKPEQHE
ncbi:TOBE domain-containing protein [Veronia pacifica]|uniref:Mop domain-containing protein n=1 Tax=Veronia pacifica TaxID=1080227 RepID=A0A1C3E6F3_9GAMM|nr:TOBE domain-containing protein [Veronia pacifica]ODA28749.1 hypothetical protein A8L45_23040 [Veronia pacifica]